jgi:DNA-directed RNA polymerase subunit RPC12/RpoP
VQKDSKKICVCNRPVFEEWDFEKNGNINPKKIGFSSKINVWWKCKKCNFEWETSPLRRNQGYKNCPRCESLGIKNVELAKEWDAERNSLSPFDVPCGSKISVWWSHEIGGSKHIWRAGIRDRNRGNGCPYCSGAKVSEKNRLSTKLPNVAAEWHPTKNGELTPDDVSIGSSIKIWWKCKKCKEEWITEIYHRNDGNKCPQCNSKNKVSLLDGSFCDSKTEAYFYIIFKNCNINFLYNKKYGGLGKKGNSRYDFYFPDFNLYMEVTGYTKETLRDQQCKWSNYIKKIKQKEKYVTQILKANFKFVSCILTQEEMDFVNKNIKEK